MQERATQRRRALQSPASNLNQSRPEAAALGSLAYRDAVSLEGPPFFEVGGGVTTPVNSRIMPSDLLRT